MSRRKENKDDLNDFEKNFLGFYLKNGFNGSGAYILAKPGSATTTARVEASKLLAKPNVLNELELRKEIIRIEENIELSFLVKELKTIINEVKEQETERDHRGKLVARPDTKSRLAAIAQLSKLGGFESKKIDVTSNGENIPNEIIININKSKLNEIK